MSDVPIDEMIAWLRSDIREPRDDWCGQQRKYDRMQRAVLSVLEAQRWRLMTETPDKPVQAELFLGNAVWHDHATGAVCPECTQPPHDSRREIAYWDGEVWRELNTNHEIYESWRDPRALPTHWRPLTPPPSDG